jgi:uncharacterized lipoprotein YajG
MRNPLVTRLVAVMLAACAIASAQLKVGDKAPVIKADSILHPKMKSLAEVKGKLVLYEYFAYW